MTGSSSAKVIIIIYNYYYYYYYGNRTQGTVVYYIIIIWMNTYEHVCTHTHIPGEITISFHGREQRMLISRGWTRRAIDQTLSVESREDDVTINGLSTWQAKPTQWQSNINISKLLALYNNMSQRVINVELIKIIGKTHSPNSGSVCALR